MDTKWKSFKIKAARELNIAAAGSTFCTVWLIILAMRQYGRWDYVSLTAIALTISGGAAIICDISAGFIWLKKRYGQDMELFRRAVWLWAAILQAVILIYLCMAYWIMHRQNDWICFYEELYSYGRKWIYYAVVYAVPVLAEAVLLINFFAHRSMIWEQIDQVEQQIRQINQGDLQIDCRVPETSLLYPYARALETVSALSRQATEEQLKSERMKVELITNVSHDLKTPLTSIISYLELLKKEELNDVAADYVEIISARAGHLKQMIEAVFDLAKASSGTAELKMEKLDMGRLIEQVLADMEDSIHLSDRKIKYAKSEGALEFVGDSGYLYRIVQNLIENALKYSLSGSRIFITADRIGKEIVLTTCNTANYEMDFSADEIMERFVRGDKSRTTEGNGLGLSIVKAYTEACKGKFSVNIKEDQFWTETHFPAAEVSDETKQIVSV